MSEELIFQAKILAVQIGIVCSRGYSLSNDDAIRAGEMLQTLSAELAKAREGIKSSLDLAIRYDEARNRLQADFDRVNGEKTFLTDQLAKARAPEVVAAAELLARYNDWRRGEQHYEWTAKQIGAAIDIVCAALAAKGPTNDN